jgi:6-phosphogluconate dehydrogenase (decarboxylating)
MIGGPDQAVKHLGPVFEALAPGVGDIPRTAGREQKPGTAERGYLHCGPSGAGHFVKMVHNGIEYGLMAAYAEGLNILKHANVGKAGRAHDAETTPLRDPEHFQYDFNIADITEVWRRGSVVASWLLDLTAKALVNDPALDKFSGRVSDSGEGRWTLMAAIEEGTPAPVLSAALYERFDLNLTDIAEVWRRGSVISSWLLDLSAAALAEDQMLEQFTGHVADSGEGRWTIDAAMEEAVPAYVLAAALFARYRSRVDHTFGDKLLSAMRFGFGGHVEIPQ